MVQSIISYCLVIIFLVFFQNVVADSDPIMNPFYYAQDRESWDIEVAATAREESRQQMAEERRSKKKKNKSFKNSSFIMRKEQGHVRHLIKVMVYDLDGRNMEEIDIGLDNASVNVQYIVTSYYDDIMDETNHLVGKIVHKLSKPNV